MCYGYVVPTTSPATAGEVRPMSTDTNLTASVTLVGLAEEVASLVNDIALDNEYATESFVDQKCAEACEEHVMDTEHIGQDDVRSIAQEVAEEVLANNGGATENEVRTIVREELLAIVKDLLNRRV